MLANLCIDHRQQMRSVEMFRRKIKNLLINSGRLLKITALMKNHGFL